MGENVEIVMTLTAPNCPMVDELMAEINEKVRAVEGVNDLVINLTFDPPWEKSMMTEEAMLELGLLIIPLNFSRAVGIMPEQTMNS
jgi:metal-sulfur cluster biosynthetic enzyme